MSVNRASLISGLGGEAGFGENFLDRNDDRSTNEIDITSIFEDGLNFYGREFDSLWINNNGSVTFNGSRGTFTPEVITENSGNPEITPFFADVDTTGGEEAATLGGNSSGSNLVYYDFDTDNDRFIVTWDDVGYFSSQTDKLNAFQLILSDQGNGDFDIEFRYENVDWTTGAASGGIDGLGGEVARAGFTAGTGDPDAYFELPASGDQDAILALDEVEGNTGQVGQWFFTVTDGEVEPSEPEPPQSDLGFDFGHWWQGLETSVSPSAALVANNDEVSGRFGWLVNGNLFSDNGHGNDQGIGDSSGVGMNINNQKVSFGEMVSLDSGATISVMENGDFVYDQRSAFDSAAETSAVDTFEYTIEDGQGGESSAVVSVELDDVIDGVEVSAIEALYQVAFDREADAGGLEYWSGIRDEGVSMFDIADAFFVSDEFVSEHSDSLSDDDFLTLLYDNAFDREPDAEGFNHWSEGLEAGQLDQGDVMAYFASSDEMQTKYLAEGFIFA